MEETKVGRRTRGRRDGTPTGPGAAVALLDSPGGDRPLRRILQGAAGASIGVLFASYPVFTSVLALAFGLIALLFWSFPLLVQLLVVVRPSLDILTFTGIPIGSLQLNVPGALGVFVVGAGLLHLFDAKLRGERLDRGGAPAAALALLTGSAALGAVVGYHNLGSTYLGIGMKEAIRLGSLLVLYLVLVHLLRRGMSEAHLLRALYLSALFPMAWATWQFTYYLSEGWYTGDPQAVPHGRLDGTFSHPNAFGMFLALLILLTLTALRSRRTVGLPRWFLVGFMLYAGFLLVYTFSRSSWVFLAICLCLMMILNPRRMLGPVLAVLLLGAFFFGPKVVARFSDLRTSFSLTQVLANRAMANSFEWRIYNWGVLIGVGLDKPILGHGTGTTPAVNPNLSGAPQGDNRGFSAHSAIVSFFVEQGLVGIGVLAAYFAILLRWLRRRYAEAKAMGSAALDLTGLALQVMIAFLVGSILTQNQLSNTATYYSVAAILAIVRVDEIRSAEVGGPAAWPGTEGSEDRC